MTSKPSAQPASSAADASYSPGSPADKPAPKPKADITFEAALSDSQVMNKFPRLKGRQKYDVLGRMQILHNLSSLFHEMLPFVDLLDEQGYGKEKWAMLRMLMLPEHKESTIATALQAVPRWQGSRGGEEHRSRNRPVARPQIGGYGRHRRLVARSS